MKNKLVIWRIYNGDWYPRRTGQSRRPISEVEVVNDLNMWPELPIILENMFLITDSPSGIRDMYRMQRFKGIQDDLAIDRTLFRHLSTDETLDHKDYREQLRAGANLLKLKLIQEMHKLGGKEYCTITIFQYCCDLQRVSPHYDAGGRRVLPYEFTVVDGTDYINWAFLLCKSSSIEPL